MGKTSLKTLQKSYGEQPHINRLQKLAIGTTQQKNLLSVYRPVDRPTVEFPTVVPSVDRPVDRGQIQRAYSLSSRPPGRPGPFQRAELSGRSTGSVDRPSARSRRAHLYTSIDRAGRPTSELVDYTVDLLKPETEKLKGLKCCLYRSNKIP